ncbi:hypothetical protein F2P81_003651 [Scophthalmus maximus]|uniref:Uncharacterized protein n=1 Tax=Scophthalmus maximus TaxID=52904 RepID=A0A6A4TES0_SCOMX|nr:hypothetical protein F2P81_003651 [Scophthalmus maximus]
MEERKDRDEDDEETTETEKKSERKRRAVVCGGDIRNDNNNNNNNSGGGGGGSATRTLVKPVALEAEDEQKTPRNNLNYGGDSGKERRLGSPRLGSARLRVSATGRMWGLAGQLGDLQLAAVRESTGVDAELIVAARYRETCAIINLPDTQRRRVQPASPGSDRSSRNDEDKRTSGHIMTGHRGS